MRLFTMTSVFSELTVLFFLGGLSLHAAPPPSRQTEDEKAWRGLSDAARQDLTSVQTRNLLQNFVRQFPDHPRTPGADYALAEADFIRPSFEKAAVGFQKFIQTYPSHALADSAAFRLGECYYNLSVPHSAATEWQRVVKNYPGSALWPDAVIRLARLAIRRKAWGEADELLKNLRTRQPGAANREEARELKGIVDYHLGEYSASLQALEGLELDGAAYYRGLSYFGLKLYTESADALKSLPSRGPAAYRESSAFLKGESFFQSQNYTLASTEFKAFQKTYPKGSLAPVAKMRVAGSHLLLGEPGESLRWVKEVQSEKVAPELKAYIHYIEGAAHLARNDNAAAVRAFESVLQGSAPPALASAAWIRRAWAHHRLGENAAVDICLKSLEEAFPASPDVALAHFLRGARHFEKGQWEDAGSVFEAALLRFPYSEMSEVELALMALAYTKAGRQDHLTTAAKAALRLFAANYSTASTYWRGQSHFFVGRAYFDLKRFKEAGDHYFRLVTDYPAHPLAKRAELLLAWCNEEQGQHAKARELAQRLVDSKDTEKVLVAHATFLEAVTHFNQKDYDKALSRLAAFVNQYPQNPLTPEAQYLIGLGYHQKGVFGSAIDQWTILFDKFPKDERARLAYLHIGDLYFKAGRFPEAAKYLGEFQKRWPKDDLYGERALWKEVQALFNGTDNDAAIAGYKRYVAAYPQGPNAADAEKQLEMVYYRRGEQGDPAKIEEFLRTYPASPFAPAARYRLGAMAMDQSKWERAAIEFEQFTRDYPKDPLAVEATFALGQAYENMGEESKALLQYQGLMERFQTSAQSLDAAFRLGAVHFGKERYKEAAVAYEFAAKRKLSDQQKANVHYNLALCYENLGQTESAAKAYGQFAQFSKDAQAAREAEMAAGLLLKKAEKWAPAETHFAGLAKRPDASDEERLQAVNLLAETQLAGGRRKEGLKTYERLSGMGPPSHDLRLAGLAQLAYQLEQDKALSQAVRVYEQIAISGGKAEWVQAARARVDALNQQMTVTP